MIKIIPVLVLAVIFIGCSNKEISKHRYDYLVAPKMFQAYQDGIIDYKRYLRGVKRELLLRKLYGQMSYHQYLKELRRERLVRSIEGK